MTQTYHEMIQRLRQISVAQISTLKAKDEDLISFRKDGVTHWNDEPDFISERRGFSQGEWFRAEKYYRHYFGFTYSLSSTSPNLNCEGPVYFQQSDHSEQPIFGFSLNQDDSRQAPPNEGEWIAGDVKLVTVGTKKGLRFRNWFRIPRFAVYIRYALINEQRIAEERITEVQDATWTNSGKELVHFARLIVNEQIEYYLDLKRQFTNDATSTSGEKYLGRLKIDGIVHQTTMGLRSDLWEIYKETSISERLFSGIIPEPAPEVIRDNARDKAGKPIGINTPFAALVSFA